MPEYGGNKDGSTKAPKANAKQPNTSVRRLCRRPSRRFLRMIMVPADKCRDHRQGHSPQSQIPKMMMTRALIPSGGFCGAVGKMICSAA
mmetsp:Transcript_18525/g.38277  ORF Transcript_18525/g.38277 Transcript_18525/m.38277 type:complete len:89 (-) Transcript_18525:78-344(-)